MAEFSASLSPQERRAVNFTGRDGWTYSNDETEQRRRIQALWLDLHASAAGVRRQRQTAEQREAAAQLKKFLATPLT